MTEYHWGRNLIYILSHNLQQTYSIFFFLHVRTLEDIFNDIRFMGKKKKRPKQEGKKIEYFL